MRLLCCLCVVFLLSGEAQMPQAQEVAYDTKEIQTLRCNGAKRNLEHVYKHAPNVTLWVAIGAAYELHFAREFFSTVNVFYERVAELCGARVASQYKCDFLKTTRDKLLKESRLLIGGLRGEKYQMRSLRQKIDKASEMLFSQQTAEGCHRFG